MSMLAVICCRYDVYKVYQLSLQCMFAIITDDKHISRAAETDSNVFSSAGILLTETLNI